jgi:hypothetical protein
VHFTVKARTDSLGFFKIAKIAKRSFSGEEIYFVVLLVLI